jgi:MYXO-CTERM domain-containing protein
VSLLDGYAVLSLTADDAVGPDGARPEGAGGTSGGSWPGTNGDDDGGCSVATSGAPRPGFFLGMLGLAALSVLRRQKRRPSGAR